MSRALVAITSGTKETGAAPEITYVGRWPGGRHSSFGDNSLHRVRNINEAFLIEIVSITRLNAGFSYFPSNDSFDKRIVG